MHKRFLVTGAEGFIGTHLVTALRAQGNHVETVGEDLAGPLPTNVDGVFHLAAVLGSRDQAPDPYTAIRVNSRLMEQLLRVYRHLTIPIVFTATTEVYYGQPTTLPTPETAPVGWSDAAAPRWAYSIGKFVAEQLLLHSTPRARIARLGNVYGSGARHGVVRDLIDQALTGEAWTVRNPADTRTFCYVDDVVDGLLRLIDTPECDGEIVNLAGDQPISIAHLAEEIRDLTIAPAPAHTSSGPAEARWPAIEQAKRLLEWTPKVVLQDGLARTIAWRKGDHAVS